MKKPFCLVTYMGIDPDIFDINLIPHFLQWYRKRGISDFYICVHACLEKDLQPGVSLLRECGIEPFFKATGRFDVYRASKTLLKISEMVPFRYCAIVDSDEFVHCDFSALFDDFMKQGAHVVKGEFIDRIAPDYFLREVKPDIPLWEQFPRREHITRDIIGGSPYKYFFIDREKVLLRQAQHLYIPRVSETINVYPRLHEIHHYKWTASMKRRIEKRKNDLTDYARFSWSNEWKKTLDIVDNGYLQTKKKG